MIIDNKVDIFISFSHFAVLISRKASFDEAKGPCKRTRQFTTLLRVVGQQCCVRLYGPESLAGFKLYVTSANIVVVPCKQMQHVGPNNDASVCMGL